METGGGVVVQWGSVDAVVSEIMRIHRSLPSRPGIEDVEAARSVVRNVDAELQLRLDAVSRQSKTPAVPEELFSLLTEMQRNHAHLHAREEKRDALRLLDLDSAHSLFDDLIQRASRCLSSSSPSSASPSFSPDPASAPSMGAWSGSRDDTFITTTKKPSLYSSDAIPSTARPLPPASSADGDKLSLIKLASLIEVSAKKGTRELNLSNKLMDQIEWLPDSIGKLSALLALDLSENRILALPPSIGGMSSLTRLDLHSNSISQLPDSIGDLLSLVFLDLRANQLSSLPSTFGRLVRLQELDLSSNRLSVLPDSIGSLVSLKKLIFETNDIEELPHTIGMCSALTELRADYNKLKALPEAVGKIETLEVLAVRYNNIKQLPTTMSSLTNLKELDVSFNELESVPESLCFATSLVKMNIGNNFADLRSLPRSIGNLENLEELDISNNQIRVLPDSFRMLSRLRILRVEENPLEVPARHIAEKGAQAVVQYMADLVEKRNIKPQVGPKQKKCWTQICFFSKSNKRKRGGGSDYVKT